MGNKHTLVLGAFGDFSEQLDKVGKVIAEEFGANNKVLAGVESGQLAAEQFCFTNYSKCGSLFGIL